MPSHPVTPLANLPEMVPSGLLMSPADWPIGGLHPGEQLEDVFERALAALDVLAIRLPLFDGAGVAVVPPDAHVADHLARAWALDDEDWIIENAPVAVGTVEVVAELPRCDVCGTAGARYHGRVIMAGESTRCGSMCAPCVRLAEERRLGPGGCVYLLIRGEVSDELAERVDSRLRELDRDLLFRRG
jgi:hypothetical protein